MLAPLYIERGPITVVTVGPSVLLNAAQLYSCISVIVSLIESIRTAMDIMHTIL